MDIHEFFKEVKTHIFEGEIEKALELLKSKINYISKAYTSDIYLLSSRFFLARKEFLLDTITHEDYQVIRSKTVSTILGIIEKIKSPDDQVKKRRPGEILYRIPSGMKVNVEYRCLVRIAYDIESLLKNIDFDTNSNVESIQVSEVMSVSLVSLNENDAFEIRELNIPEQFIIHEDFTQWIFLIKPLLIGKFSLFIKVAAIEIINDKERKRDIVFEKEIVVESESAEVKESSKYELISISRDPTEIIDFIESRYWQYISSSNQGQNNLAHNIKMAPYANYTDYIKVLSKRLREAVEEKSWLEVSEANSTVSYINYIKRYPFGKFVTDAKAKINSEDDEIWAEAILANSNDGYRHYLLKVPHGKYRLDAKYRLSLLEEDKEWSKAVRIDSRKSYKNFLSRYPSGRYYKQAKDRISDLKGGSNPLKKGCFLIFLYLLVIIVLLSF